MAWERLKRFLGRQEENAQQTPDEHQERFAQNPSDFSDVSWIEAADNAWGVRALDLRPVTLNMLSTSTDPQCAANAVSFGQDDGTSFIGEEPPSRRIAEASLRFPIDRILADGVLFVAREMEHKWAIFYHGGQIICVRSWRRKVQVVASVEERQDHVEIVQVRGVFTDEDEEPQFTIRALDYLLRSHALNMVYPAPLPFGAEADPKAAAIWCFSMFGNRALIATPYRFDRHDPDQPLRTYSLLHIAVARGNGAAIERYLAAGVPIDLLDGEGFAPLHWALTSDDPAIMSLLLERGSSVDVRSAEGATPLMNAVQDGSVDKMCFLLDHGADVDARDRRGFTALHRAAEMGRLEALQALLDRGAAPNLEAEGHTPRSLAEALGNGEIVAILNRYISAAS